MRKAWHSSFSAEFHPTGQSRALTRVAQASNRHRPLSDTTPPAKPHRRPALSHCPPPIGKTVQQPRQHFRNRREKDVGLRLNAEKAISGVHRVGCRYLSGSIPNHCAAIAMPNRGQGAAVARSDYLRVSSPRAQGSAPICPLPSSHRLPNTSGSGL
jgi:hypothetical protein